MKSITKFLSGYLILSMLYSPLLPLVHAQEEITSVEDYKAQKSSLTKCTKKKESLAKEINALKAELDDLESKKKPTKFDKKTDTCINCCAERNISKMVNYTNPDTGEVVKTETKAYSILEIYNIELKSLLATPDGELDAEKLSIKNHCKKVGNCQISDRELDPKYYDLMSNSDFYKTGGSCGKVFAKVVPAKGEAEAIRIFSALLPLETEDGFSLAGAVNSCWWNADQMRIAEIKLQLDAENEDSIQTEYVTTKEKCAEIASTFEDCPECYQYELEAQQDLLKVNYLKQLLSQTGGSVDGSYMGAGGVNVLMPQPTKLQQLTPIILGGLGVVAGGLNGYFNYRSNQAWANASTKNYKTYMNGYGDYASGAQELGIPYYPPSGPGGSMSGMMGMNSGFSSMLGGALGGLGGYGGYGSGGGIYLGGSLGGSLGGYNPYAPYSYGGNPYGGSGGIYLGGSLGGGLPYGGYGTGGGMPYPIYGAGGGGYPYGGIGAGVGIGAGGYPYGGGGMPYPIYGAGAGYPQYGAGAGVGFGVGVGAGGYPYGGGGMPYPIYGAGGGGYPYGGIGTGVGIGAGGYPYGGGGMPYPIYGTGAGYPQYGAGAGVGFGVGIGAGAGYPYYGGGVPPFATPPYYPTNQYPMNTGYPVPMNGFPGYQIPMIQNYSPMYSNGPSMYPQQGQYGWNNPAVMGTWQQSMGYQQQMASQYQAQMQTQQYYSQQMAVVQQQLTDAQMNYQSLYQQMMSSTYGSQGYGYGQGGYNCGYGMCGSMGVGANYGYGTGSYYGYGSPSSCGAGQAMSPTGVCIPTTNPNGSPTAYYPTGTTGSGGL